MYKVQILSVKADDQESITAIQKKLNQWNTAKLLKKYEMHATATHIVFNICLAK